MSETETPLLTVVGSEPVVEAETPAYVPPALTLTAGTVEDVVAEGEGTGDPTLDPTAETEESEDKQIPAAMMRYMNGLMEVTTGVEKGIQRLTHLVATKTVDTRIAALYHKCTGIKDVEFFGCDISVDLESVLKLAVRNALESTAEVAAQLKKEKEIMFESLRVVTAAFPEGSYARDLWTPWLITLDALLQVIERYAVIFVQAGRMAKVENADLGLILNSLVESWTTWAAQLTRMDKLPGDQKAHAMVKLADDLYREYRAAGIPLEQAVAHTIETLNKDAKLEGKEGDEKSVP